MVEQVGLIRSETRVPYFFRFGIATGAPGEESDPLPGLRQGLGRRFGHINTRNFKFLDVSTFGNCPGGNQERSIRISLKGVNTPSLYIAE
jgi:hypothetical protein